MVTMDYIQNESTNQGIIVPYEDPNIHQFNNTLEGKEEKDKWVFIDILTILFCMFSVLPTISICLYSMFKETNKYFWCEWQQRVETT